MFDFPDDLLTGQGELRQVRADLLALLKRLPWSVQPLDGEGWFRVKRPASPGWTADEQTEVARLRQRSRDLAEFVICHGFWSQLAPSERVDARAQLKHAHETEDRDAR